MDYFCDVCVKTGKKKSKSKHHQNLSYIIHKYFQKFIRIKHTNEIPDFFDIDELYNKNVTNQNKKKRFLSGQM